MLSVTTIVTLKQLWCSCKSCWTQDSNFSPNIILYCKQKGVLRTHENRGLWNGLVSKGTCGQAWQAELSPWDPHSGRKEPIPARSLWHVAPVRPISHRRNSKEMEKYLRIFEQDSTILPSVERLVLFLILTGILLPIRISLAIVRFHFCLLSDR